MNDFSAEQPYRTPAQVREEGNHLRDEQSRHLRQHARGPIDWYPWGEAAFARARAENKPVFLSIGYASCHACNVMAVEVFEDDAVAELLNRNFVCVKVDREEHPGVDTVYLRAVQLMVKRGGWPLSVFLTADRKPFFGGTYVPRDTFLELAGKVSSVYGSNQHEFTEEAARLSERVTAMPELPDDAERPAALETHHIDAAANQIQLNFDKKWGGFSGAPKFPVPVRWRFLLTHHRATGRMMYRNLTEVTLEFMASGGMFDQIGGGFHHFATDRKWLIPHYEKLLYDNAQLASLYLEAGVIGDRADFREIGSRTLDFMVADLLGEEGAFHASLAAGSRDGEGAYYQWTPDEITIATNADDGPVLAALLGVGLPGNVEGTDRNVLSLRADVNRIAEEFEWNRDAVVGLLAKHRRNLIDFRAQRAAPGRDRKIVTAWNGLAVSALVLGYELTGGSRYGDTAAKVADFLWNSHRAADGTLVRCSTRGRPSGEAVLTDYALLACGLLDLHRIGAGTASLERALTLIDQADALFAAEKGGYYYTPSSIDAPLGRLFDLFDASLPSGNAAMLHVLIKAGIATDDAGYHERARKTLAHYAPLLTHTQLETAGWFAAAELLARRNDTSAE